MFDEEIKRRRRRRRIVRVSLLIPFLLLVILFWREIGDTLGFFWQLMLDYIGISVPSPTLETFFSLSIVGFLFLGFIGFFVFWLFLISGQALLPAFSLGEIAQTAAHLVFYIFRIHGPAVSVKDGKLLGDARELRRNYPGVAVVDSNSALALEQVSSAPGMLRAVLNLLFRIIDRVIEIIFPLGVPREPVRVRGPGITFIRFDERIQGVGELPQERGSVAELSGVVDLRKQFKISPKQSNAGPEMSRTSVSGYTRDGIELTTNVWILYSIGIDADKDPSVLHIISDGKKQPDNLRVVSIEDKGGVVQLKDAEEELDPDDRDDIFAYLSSGPTWGPYAQIQRQDREPVFDSNRVFSAVFGHSHSKDGKKPVLPWMDLPVKVAVECFREILSHYNFDELYRPDASGALKIGDLRKELRIRMRNSGLLCYRLVAQQRPGWPLILNGTGIFPNKRDLLVSPVQALKASKILRDRGILVMAAGFGDLVPADDVYLQRLASWRAEWERETISARAAAELEAVQIYNHARARAQQDLVVSFREIYENGRYPKEALVLHVLQALESIATDPSTHRLLPGDTTNMLRSIHDWLLPGDVGFASVAGLARPAMPPDEGER